MSTPKPQPLNLDPLGLLLAIAELAPTERLKAHAMTLAQFVSNEFTALRQRAEQAERRLAELQEKSAHG